MEPIAVISDIHANVEALTAVLADIEQRGVRRIICLGDVVGYGPQPRECVDLIMQVCETTLMGNHDFALMFEPENFNQGAEVACYWTRQEMESERDRDAYRKRLEFMGRMPVRHVIAASEHPAGPFAFCHGSPRRPINEYIFPDDVYNHPAKLASVFDRIDHICLVGHTHVPGVFSPTPAFFSDDDIAGLYEFDERKAVLNVGSVGQPRDRDPRASYVIIEEDAAHFIRVPYDVESTVQKVLAIRELDDYLGIRLRDGR
jgi:predicted phosphodiesterase